MSTSQTPGTSIETLYDHIYSLCIIITQEGLGLHPLMYTVQWFLCLFTFLPCWDTVLLICDLLLLEGQCLCACFII